MIVLLIIAATIIIVAVIIYRSKDEQHYYEKEMEEINVVKGKATLSTEILEILSEEGYRPTIEKEGETEIIMFKIEGDAIEISFTENDPDYIFIKYHICTFEPNDKYEVFESVNQLNINIKFITALIYDNLVFITCGYLADSDGNIKNMLFRYLNAVINGHNEFWRLKEERNSWN